MRVYLLIIACLAILLRCMGHAGSPPDYEHAVEPELSDWITSGKVNYPEEARLLQQTGTVWIGFMVGSDGRPSDVKVIKSSGWPILDRDALAGMGGAQLKPRLIGKLCKTPVRYGIVHGVEEGYKREYGHGFYGIDRAHRNPVGSWEAVGWRRDLYYRGVKLDESAYALISPSGRYAVYTSGLYGGTLLFDTQSGLIYRVQDVGIALMVEHWDNGERRLRLNYCPDPTDGNRVASIEIEIGSLKTIGSASVPPAPRK